MSCSWSTRATSEPAIVWEHVSESRADLKAAFAGSGLLVPTRAAQRVVLRIPRRDTDWAWCLPAARPRAPDVSTLVITSMSQLHAW
jgi:hypothetical protein